MTVSTKAPTNGHHTPFPQYESQERIETSRVTLSEAMVRYQREIDLFVKVLRKEDINITNALMSIVVSLGKD